MKKIIFIISCLAIVSCEENSAVKKKEKGILDQKTNVVEEVGNSKRIDPFQKNYRSNEGMMEDVYNQLILNDKELIKLDTKIKDLKNYSNEVLQKYRTVLDKSDHYYQDVLGKSKSFSDTILRNKMDSLTIKSSQNFQKKTKDVRILIATSEKNLKNLDDAYTAFKIQRTLHEIEKYQNDHTFELQNLNDVITKQTQTLKELETYK